MTETDPVSETLCFLVSRISGDGQSPSNNFNLMKREEINCRNIFVCVTLVLKFDFLDIIRLYMNSPHKVGEINA
jgi:hypothetical protein